MHAVAIHSVSPDIHGGWSEQLREALGRGADFGCAAPRARDLDALGVRSGAAWTDPALLSELRTRHRQWGADPSSFDAIDRLASGAGCVIAGQQPGLLVGPAYTLWKILAAVALAEDLTVRTGRPVVPVFWAGTDDSDFEEVRSAWLWKRDHGTLRARIDAGLHRPGQTLAALRGAGLPALERGALESAGIAGSFGGILDRLQTVDGLVDRAVMWVLELFAGRGLVVVEASNPMLRRWGRPLFEKYAGLHRDLAEQISSRSGPLDRAALESGLFVVRDGIRRKLLPEELDRRLPDPESLAPSVILRPLLQDAALSPLVAVLGPGELAYHAQLAPMYAALGVDGARPALRPHVTILPDAWRWPDEADPRQRLLGGGPGALDVLAEASRDAELADRLARFEREIGAAWDSLTRDTGMGQDRLARRRARLQKELDAMRREIERETLQRVGLDPALAEWVAPRGGEQDRFYSAIAIAHSMGEDRAEIMERIAAEYVRAVDEGTSTAWVVERSGAP